jgi:hypothetical protein
VVVALSNELALVPRETTPTCVAVVPRDWSAIERETPIEQQAPLPDLTTAALGYCERGLATLPLPLRDKAPNIRDWPSLRLTSAQIPAAFAEAGGIGLILGEASRWLVNVDLDDRLAIELAPGNLPHTDCVTGRPSKPRSHYWYIAVGAPTSKFTDPLTGAMIVEQRSTGCQTLVGPSIHPSGEPYDLLPEGAATVDADLLTAAVAKLAEAVVVQRYGSVPAERTKSLAPAPSQSVAPDVLLRRAEAYLRHMPAAISGSGGHNKTYAAATVLVHGFGISTDDAFRLLRDQYNPRCEPPWTAKELRHKIDDAANRQHRMPFGWLRDARVHDDFGEVDLSAFYPLTVTVELDEPAADDDLPKPPVDPGPFPEHLLYVPGFVSEVMAYNAATATRPQPVLALAGALALQSVLAGRKVRDGRGNRTNTYTVCMGGSGSGKEHARTINKQILFEAGLINLQAEDLASDAGLVTAVHAEPAILFQIDEFGRWLRTIGDPKKAPHLFNVISVLMKLYSSAKTVFQGKKYADSQQNKSIDQPCVSLLATTAPEHFRQALTPESTSDGFIARLFIFEASGMPQRAWQEEQPVPGALIEAARWWAEFSPGGNLSQQHPVPRVVNTTPDARALFDALATLADEQAAEGDEARTSIWARAEEKACRMALIYACSKDRENPVIDADAARWACELSEYMTRRLQYLAYEHVAMSDFDARQKALLRIARRYGNQITRTQLCRATQHLTMREREDVINNLLATGQLKEVKQPTGGRPGKIYQIPSSESATRVSDA